MILIFPVARAERAFDKIPELARAHDVYRVQLETINRDKALAMDAVDKAYIEALERLEAVFRDRGELHGLLAIRSEKNRYRATPDSKIVDVTPLPEDVKKLAELHAQHRQEVEQKEADRLQALIQQYTGFLDNLKRDLTRQDRIEDALTVERTIAAVRGSDAYEKMQSVHATVAEPSQDTSFQRTAGPLYERLADIGINEFRFTIYDPFRPINGLIDVIHPHGIGFKVETEDLPLGSVSHDNAGKPTFRRQYGADFQSPRLIREISLANTNARDALRSICTTFGLGYRFEDDTVVLVDADDARAVWSCHSITAETIAGMFVHDNADAVARLRRQNVRITGALTGITRSVSGSTVAMLYAERPVRVELTAVDDVTELLRLQEAFRQQQDHASRYGQTGSSSGRSGIRRMGEDLSLASSPPSGPVVMLSVVAEYQTQMGQTIVFTRGRDLAWQRVHRYNP